MNASPREWLIAILSTGQCEGRIETESVDSLVATARDEGLLPLLEWTLRASPGWHLLPGQFQEALKSGAREAAAESLFRESELRRVGRILQTRGIRVLVLKGNALGQWLYHKPYLRVTRDIDLLVESRGSAEKAASACAELGYRLEFSPGASNYEMTCRLMVAGINRSEVDLHSRLINAAAYAGIFSFEDLWHASITLPTMEDTLKGLCPRHALAHACLNRALDMQIGEPDPLKLRYDIHLLMSGMDADEWTRFLAMASEKRIGGICLRTIGDTVATFATPLPDGVLGALMRAAENEPIDWRRLHDWRYMQWQNLRSLPSAHAKVAWLWGRIFPTMSHLRSLHGEGRWIKLMYRRFMRALQRMGAH